MKTKIYLSFMICFLLAINLHGQIVFQDDFSVDLSKWTFSGDYSQNWSVRNTSYAGKEAPELIFKGRYPNDAPDKTSRMISSNIDLSNYKGRALVISFFQSIVHEESITMSLQTTSDGGITWNTIWSAEDDFENIMFVKCDNDDIGSETFQFSFVCSGNMKALTNWYLDNIEVSIEGENDAFILSAACEKELIGPGDFNSVGIFLRNTGTKALSSVTINYQLDDREPVSETKEDIDIAPSSTSVLSFQEQITNVGTGTHTIKAWITTANEVTVPDRVTFTTFNVTSGIPAIKKMAMVESFTSATCGPCAPVNVWLNPLLDKNMDKVVVVKYQMAWPSQGDPYSTDEGMARRSYYGVNSIPTFFVEALETEKKEEATQNAINKAAETPAEVDIKGVFYTTGRNISINAYITPFISGSYKVHVVVCEKKTTGNALSKEQNGNGETEFHHVMMKMFPDALGKTYNFNPGETIALEIEEDLSKTHVEEMDDLEVAIFIQENKTKEILNAAYLAESNYLLRPPTGVQIVADGYTAKLSWDAPSPAVGIAGYNVYRYDTRIAENIQETSYIDAGLIAREYQYYVSALYADGLESAYVPANVTIIGPGQSIEKDNPDALISIYPNPVNDMLYINTEAVIEGYQVYDIQGRIVCESDNHVSEISTQTWPSGAYIIRIETGQNTVIRKFIKQ